MINYVKRKRILAKLKEEIDFNWQMQKSYGELTTSIKDPMERRHHLDMQTEYIHRWSESVRLYNMLKQIV